MLEVKKQVSEAMEVLKGTFAIWAFNSKTNKTYLARSASTLFANPVSGCFSSTEFQGSESLKEGIVYIIQDYSSIVPAGKFKHKSPYFVF